MKIKIDEQPNRICKYYLDILEEFYLKNGFKTKFDRINMIKEF